MDGVLEAATALCVCKVICSLLFLPSLAACFSPVSFCSCCLLIFTDFLVAVFLSFLCFFKSWLLTGLADLVALRFLLFLSHTYGAVLLLSTPLIAVETLVRLLWPHTLAAHRRRCRLMDCHVVEAKAEEEEEEEEEDEDEEKDRKLFHVIGYFCCLSLWAIIAFKLRWKWRLGEAWASACLHATSSLVRCLPRMHSPVHNVGPPCWSLVFVVLLLILILLILVTSSLDRWMYAPAGGEIQQAPSAPARRGDPEKTASSCSSAHSVQMSARLHGDEALASPACLSGKRGRREQERTKRGSTPLTFTAEEDGSRCRWRLGAFPRPGADVIIGFVALLSVFVLPLYLSVNILVIRTLETLLEDCIISLVSPPVHTGDAPPPRNDTLV